MIDNLLGGNDDEATADESDEEMGGLFDDPGDAGAGDGDDDLMGGDGMMDGGDGMMDGGDGMMDGGDDLVDGDDDLMGGADDLMGDDGDDAGSSNGEVNNRIEELENEVDSLSSTVNTVKSENEQISESLDDVEENIRKLLEVYEMVTRGVNPFVDENELGDAFGGGGGAGGDGGSMGLFGGDEQQEETSDIDDSVVNADADEFFDDDLGDLDDDFEDDFEQGSGDGFDEEFEDAEELEGETGGETADPGDGVDGGDPSEGGKSFEDLKSEYESRVAARASDDSTDEEPDADADSSAPGAATASETDGTGDSTPDAGNEGGGGKPYLQELPAGYGADVVVMDWLEFLVDEGGVDGAARTIAYYEAIDWVSESAAESLQTYLRGFGDGVEADPEPRSWLTVAHHNTSLRFISRIDDPSMELVRFDERRGRPWPDEVADETSGEGFATGNGHHPQRAVGSPSTDERELESDGGRRTYAEPGRSAYEPATARRSRDAQRDENGSGGATDEVGYGGFCWNHDGN